jgi:streptogramin lyase
MRTRHSTLWYRLPVICTALAVLSACHHGRHPPSSLGVAIPVRPAGQALVPVMRVVRAHAVRYLPARRRPGGAQPAFRLVDPTLLHDLTVSADGAVWIAPFFNGFQWGGTYERVVRYDPRTHRMQAYKLQRLPPSLTAVAPAGQGRTWAVNGLLAGVFTPDGSWLQTVAPDVTATLTRYAVDPAGNLWAVEPGRAALARLDTHRVTWTEVLFPPKIGTLGDVSVAQDGSVWFTTIEVPRLGRYDPLRRTFSVVRLPQGAGHPVMLCAGGRNSVWFLLDDGTLGSLTPGGGATPRIILWKTPAWREVSIAGDRSGIVILADGRVYALDAVRASLRRVALPAPVKPYRVLSDGKGGAWLLADRAVAVHLDPNLKSGKVYVFLPAPDGGVAALAGPDGRLCFSAGGYPTCLYPDGSFVAYTWSYVPGMIGAVAGRNTIWLSERGRLTAVDASGRVQRFLYLADGTAPVDVAVDRRGAVWFAGRGSVTRLGPRGDILPVRVASAGDGPFGIAAAPDGTLWFTLSHAVGYVRADAGRNVTTRVFSTGRDSAPDGIAVDAHGTAWATDESGTILEIDANGLVRRHPLGDADSVPFGITVGPDRHIWFTEFLADRLGRLDPATGVLREYGLPSQTLPSSIVAGRHHLWYLDAAGFLGRVTVRGSVTRIPVPTPLP